MMEKHYEHDCDCCAFLGSETYRGTDHDLYKCGDELIARYGDEPCENRAWSVSGVGQLPANHVLHVAAQRARKRARDEAEDAQTEAAIQLSTVGVEGAIVGLRRAREAGDNAAAKRFLATVEKHTERLKDALDA